MFIHWELQDEDVLSLLFIFHLLVGMFLWEHFGSFTILLSSVIVAIAKDKVNADSFLYLPVFNIKN